MTEIERHTEVTEEGTPAPPASTPPMTAGRRSYVSRTTVMGPSAAEVASRVVIVIFGLIQVLIGLRIVLLLLNAREAHPLVRFVLDLSQVFVGPFEGILRTNALSASGSILDIAAVLALLGWTLLEMIVFWILNVFRREPA